MSRGRRNRRPAFTLVELLVVVGIIAALTALLLPSLSAARARGRAISCAVNLRTCGMGMLYYSEANSGFFTEAGHWAALCHLYIQKRTDAHQWRIDEPHRRGLNPEIPFYDCPGDRLRHPELFSVWIDGERRDVTYRLSFAMNSYISVRVSDVQAAREGRSYALGGDRLRAADIRRPGEVVLFTDAGNDNVASVAEMIWDFDEENDYGGPTLEVHHRRGNNFLAADLHVTFEKLLDSAWHRGVPPFPWRWVPVDRLGSPQVPIR